MTTTPTHIYSPEVLTRRFFPPVASALYRSNGSRTASSEGEGALLITQSETPAEKSYFSGRRVVFCVDIVVRQFVLPLRATSSPLSPHHPPIPPLLFSSRQFCLWFLLSVIKCDAHMLLDDLSSSKSALLKFSVSIYC